jgi:transcriptional regulator GlxA family with amidase domain
MDKRIFHILKAIESDLQRQWTVAEMCDQVRLSMPHFLKLFRSEVGTSPMKYVSEKRLDTAIHLIETTFLQVKEICLQIGYSNESKFAADFKARFGHTPSEYRKQLNENAEEGLILKNE